MHRGHWYRTVLWLVVLLLLLTSILFVPLIFQVLPFFLLYFVCVFCDFCFFKYVSPFFGFVLTFLKKKLSAVNGVNRRFSTNSYRAPNNIVEVSHAEAIAKPTSCFFYFFLFACVYAVFFFASFGRLFFCHPRSFASLSA